MKNVKQRILMISVIMFVFLNFSCIRTQREVSKEYKSFYVIDTIQIDHPILLEKDGNCFVASRKLVYRSRINANFFKTPGVYLIGKKHIFPNVKNRNSWRLFVLSAGMVGKNIALYDFSKEVTSFILGLVNVNYLNEENKSNRLIRIKKKKAKYLYVKVVYPLVNKDKRK